MTAEGTVERTTERTASRRDAMRAAGIAAAALVTGVALRPTEAAAGDGDPVTIGAANAGASPTHLTVPDAIVDDAVLAVFGDAADAAIIGESPGAGVVGKGIAVDGGPAGVVGEGFADDGSGAGVVGLGDAAGVFGVGEIGSLGLGAIGGLFAGVESALVLVPQDDPGVPVGFAEMGQILVDADGLLWLCVATGDPGVWIKISHGGVRLLDAPVRAYDTREGPGKFGTKTKRNVSVIDPAAAGVPTNAIGVFGNLTIVGTEGPSGFVSVYPTGVAFPGTSNINWFGPGQVLANSFMVKIGTAGKISIYSWRPTHVVVDIFAYVL